MNKGFEMCKIDLHALTNEQKSKLFDNLVENCESRNNKGNGTIFGSCQIIEMFEHDVVKLGYSKCPYCGRGG